MNEKDEIASLKAKLIALEEAFEKQNMMLDKAKTKNLELENKNRVLDVKIKQAEKDIDTYAAVNLVLSENLKIANIIGWLSKSEKLTAKQLKDFEKLLNAKDKGDFESKQDIGESGNTKEDKKPSKPLVELNSPKKNRGRQKNTKTCGRDMTPFELLDNEEFINDLRTHKDLDLEYISSLKFFKNEVQTKIDFHAAHYATRKVITCLYKDRDGKIVKAEDLFPPSIIDKGKLTNSMVASVIVDKIAYTLPLYTQAKRINLLCGCNAVNVQLLSSAFQKGADAITPIWEELYNYITSQKAIHGDESRLLVVNNTAKGKCALGQMWALSYQGNGPKAAYFRFFPGRNKEYGAMIMQECKGLAFQADGYSVYAALAKEINKLEAEKIREEEGDKAAEEFLSQCDIMITDGILLVGCLSHARRKIYQCYEIYKDMKNPELANKCASLLSLIAELYKVEKQLRPKYADGSLDESQFLEERKKLALPIMKELKAKAEAYLPEVKAAPKLEKALKYFLNQHSWIINYLECSELTPDNNFQERNFRILAAARRSCFFASSITGADAWGKLLTLTQTAILNNIDPRLYLKYLFDKMATFYRDDVKDNDVEWSKYLPWNINKDDLLGTSTK